MATETDPCKQCTRKFKGVAAIMSCPEYIRVEGLFEDVEGYNDIPVLPCTSFLEAGSGRRSDHIEGIKGKTSDAPGRTASTSSHISN